MNNVIKKERKKERKKVCFYGTVNEITKFNVDVAMTICARDYKGFGAGHVPMNGIIEVIDES